MALAEKRRRAAEARSPLERLLSRGPQPSATPALLLPLADGLHQDR